MTICDPPLPSKHKHVSLVCRYSGSVGLSETVNLSEHFSLAKSTMELMMKAFCRVDAQSTADQVEALTSFLCFAM